MPVRIEAGCRRCERAIGLSTASEAIDPAANTSNVMNQPPPAAATIAAAPAASATGPRKKSPGVRISPIPRPTAMTTQINHEGTRPILEPGSQRRSEFGQPKQQPALKRALIGMRGDASRSGIGTS